MLKNKLLGEGYPVMGDCYLTITLTLNLQQHVALILSFVLLCSSQHWHITELSTDESESSDNDEHDYIEPPVEDFKNEDDDDDDSDSHEYHEPPVEEGEDNEHDDHDDGKNMAFI